MIGNKTFVKYLIVAAAEFLGTGFMMYMGCLGRATLGYYSLQFGSLAFGLMILASMQMFGHISGAHINPAVTIAAAIMGEIPLKVVPVYFVAEILGAIAGYGILLGCLPEEVDGICVTGFEPLVTTEGQAFGIEFLITAVLIFSLCSIWDKSNPANKDNNVTLRLGLILSGLIIVAAPLTGASLNSARSLAPAIFKKENGFDGHWVYWVGPNLGAIVSALTYKFVFNKFNDEES